MGQDLSKEAHFIKDLKTSLRERGVRDKKKDLIYFFFYFVSPVCPWFILDGPEIHPLKWEKVERDLNDFLNKEGPDAVPTQTFSYWGLIRDVIKSSSAEAGKIVSFAEDFLKPISCSASMSSVKIADPQLPQPPSPGPSVIIDMSSSKDPAVRPQKPVQPLYPQLPTNAAASSEPKLQESKLTYHIFKKPHNDRLSPSEESDLEEEAA